MGSNSGKSSAQLLAEQAIATAQRAADARIISQQLADKIAADNRKK
jgi:hypothetical protein